MLQRNWRIILLLIISSFALYINSGSYGVVESSEARYAEISREMFISGDYLHPNLLNVHHYHKPPLTYQITAIGYRLFGVNTFGARFFLQIAVLIQMVLVYALAMLLFSSRKTALWAGAIYFSFPLVIVSSRNLTTDAFLTTFALCSIYAWVKYRMQQKRIFLYLFSLSLAMGFLTKGPVVLIVPLPFMFAFNWIEKSKNNLGIHHLFAGLLFAVVATSWYLHLIAQNPEFLNYFLGRHTVDRFAKDAFDRSEPFWYFIALAPAVGIPWLLILPVVLVIKRDTLKMKSIEGVLLIGIIIPLIFFSISSSKRLLYILPFYSLAALLTAHLLTRLSGKGSRNLSRVMLGYSLLVCVAFIAAMFFKTGYEIPEIFAIAGIIGIPLFICIYNSGLISTDSRPVVMSFLLSAFMIVGISELMASNEFKIKSSATVADFIFENQLENRPVLVYNARKPSIAFELNKSIISLYDGSKTLARETQFETDLGWKNYLINMEDEDEVASLKSMLKKQPTVLLDYRKRLRAGAIWLRKYYDNRKRFENWDVYY
jgi:4-amino-4-deoxy-L-arabinose transferase